MTKVKSNPSKPTKDNQFDLIDLDLVKSEREEVVSPSVTTTSVAKIQNDNVSQEFPGNPIVIAPQVSPRTIGKTVPVAMNVSSGTSLQQANYTLTGATGQPSKTFLLINNRTGVQSMLLSGNAVNRKPFSGVLESQLPQIRVRTSMGLQTIVSNTGPKTSLIAQHQKQADSLNILNKLVTDGGVKPCPNAWEFQSRPLTSPTDITFTSRSIDADGTVRTTKEYLCNFCQYKVSDQTEFESHKNTHTFSCNYCKFKALSRFDVLKHKKDKHPNFSEELAGYHDLDRLIESVNSANTTQVLNSVPLASSFPVQMSTEVPRVSSSEPPQLELQNLSGSLTTTASIERNLTPGGATVAASKALGEHFDDNFSRRSDSNTQDSENHVAGESTEESSKTRLSRPRRAVTEKMQTLRDIDSDSQAELDNKTDDDDWEEKVSKYSGRKKNKKDAKTFEAPKVCISNKTSEVIKISEDQSPISLKKLACTKFKCSACSFETMDGSLLPEHVKNHHSSDTQKSDSPRAAAGLNQNKIMRDANLSTPTKEVASTIHYSCFYCNLTSASQATMVSHVMKSHPGNAIQLKRISVPNIPSPGVIQQIQANSIGTTSAAGLNSITPTSIQGFPLRTSISPDQPLSVSVAKVSKASNMDSEGCLWGCYYCPIQSVERSEVISHLKREHPDSKLIVTRRRITHIPAAAKGTNKEGEDLKNPVESMDTSDVASGKGSSIKGDEQEGDGTPQASEKEDEKRGRPGKRKASSTGGRKRKSATSVSSEPRVLRSRRLSPGSISPSLRDGSPSHVSVNSSEGTGPPSKKRKSKNEQQDKNTTGNSKLSLPIINTECGDNDEKQTIEEQLNTTPSIVRKIQDYPKSAAIKSLAEETKWKCSYCDFKAVNRSKAVYHIMSNHSDKPVRFYRLHHGKMDLSDVACSRLRGPRSVRETNFLKNGNWLWQCPVCLRNHVSKGYLNVHLKVAHPKHSSRDVDLAPVRKCRSLNPDESGVKECSISLVRAEDMVHYDSLSNVLLDNGLSLVKALDVDDDPDIDVVRHRKYKCGKCHTRGFRPMVVKHHFLKAHSATEVLVMDLKKSQKNNKSGEGCLMYSCLKPDCKFFTCKKSELESHYNDYPEHARTGPSRSLPNRRRESSELALGSDGNDSEITDPCFERSESQSKPCETASCSEATGQFTQDNAEKQDCQVSLRMPTEVAKQLASSSPSSFPGGNNGQKNTLKTVFLSPKNSDLVSGLSLLKKSLNTTQVMNDMKKLKANGSDDQQSQIHPSRILISSGKVISISSVQDPKKS